MRKYAVLVAGGSGSRMKTDLPKQFLLLNHIPVFIHTMRAFYEAFSDIELVLVLPEAHMQIGKTMVNQFLSDKKIMFITGGDTRFQSVKNGLSVVDADSIVFVHDAVRCLISPALIQSCYQAAAEKGAAIPVIDVKDSIRMLTENGSKSIDRKQIKIVQTPQVFNAAALKKAFDSPYQETFTDEASVMEFFGYSITLVPGEENNIKITHPADLHLAEQLLAHS